MQGTVHAHDHIERIGSLLRPLLTGPACQPLAARAQGRRPPYPLLPCCSCCHAFFSLCVVCAQPKLPLPHAACHVAALVDQLSQLQGRLGRLPVCETSAGPHLHTPFAAFETVDCLQLSVGPIFSATPWHRTMYVSCVLDVCCNWMLHVYHLDVASVVSSGCCIGYTRMLQVYVLKCFIYFRRMLQVFLYVYCICCNGYTRMLQVYVSNVSSISNVCCKCIIWMLHMLQQIYTYVASVYFKCFTSFRRMLQQVLYIVSVFISRRSSRRGAQVQVVPTCMHRHGRATQKRSEMRSNRHGLACVRAAACGGRRAGAQLQLHSGQARQVQNTVRLINMRGGRKGGTGVGVQTFGCQPHPCYKITVTLKSILDDCNIVL